MTAANKIFTNNIASKAKQETAQKSPRNFSMKIDSLYNISNRSIKYLFSSKTLSYYIKYGNANIHGHQWQTMLSPREQRKVQAIMDVMNQNVTISTVRCPHKKISFKETLWRVMASVNLLPGLVSSLSNIPNSTHMVLASNLSKNSDNSTWYLSVINPYEQRFSFNRKQLTAMNRHKRDEPYLTLSKPLCAKGEFDNEYWDELDAKAVIYFSLNRKYKQELELIDSSKENISTPSVSDKNLTTEKIFTWLDSSPERNRWLHTFSISDEITKINKNLTENFIDAMLRGKIYRKFGIFLTSAQLSRELELSAYYNKTIGIGNETKGYFINGTYTIRQIFLQAPFHPKITSAEAEKEPLVPFNVTLNGSDRDNFISYLEFIVNDEPLDLLDEFYRLFKFFDTSQDVDDAYVNMAKNRLVSALFPILNGNKMSYLRHIIEHWIDGRLEEKLVGFEINGEQTLVPGIIAITEPTGGLMISLATGNIYCWTPYDASNDLKKFISGHLPLRQQAWLDDTELKPLLDNEACVLKPAIILITSSNIWHDLKKLDIKKLDENLIHNNSILSRPEVKRSDHSTLQQLLAVGNAIALLAFFLSGGSPPGCAALMLTNLITGGVSSALYIHSALTAEDPQQRTEAWQSALFSIILTGLGGAADVYSLAKSVGSEGLGVLQQAATKIQKTLNAGSSVRVAETFIKGTTRERTVMLINSLLKETESQMDMFGQNSVQAMIRVLRICGRINDQQSRNDNTILNAIFSNHKTKVNKESLTKIPAGYEVAIIDKSTSKLELLMLSLGDGKFAGYDLQKVSHLPPSPSGWHAVETGNLEFKNDDVLLSGDRLANAYVDSTAVKSLPFSNNGVINRDSDLMTRFRRYCNLYKFYGNIGEMYHGLEKFAIENGFKDIKYRCLFIFDPKFKESISRHFLLSAKRDDINYIFEPNAEKIRFIMLPEIDDVTILTEEKWVESFEKSGSNALITFKDFASEFEAKNYESTFDVKGNNEKLLLSPAGFSELMGSSHELSYSMLISLYDDAQQSVLIQKKVRSIISNDRSSDNSYEFVLTILKSMGSITQSRRELLISNYNAHPLEAIKKIMDVPIPVSSFSDMLRIESGRLVRFTKLGDESVSHVMICIGNGRFAGMNNAVLNFELRDEKRILVAEQLGFFWREKLYTYGDGNAFFVEKGDLPSSGFIYRPLMTIAREYEASLIYNKSSVRFVLEMLVAAKRIAPQQADALERLANLMVSKLDGARLSLAKLHKFIKIEIQINEAIEFDTIAPGKLLVFYTEDKDFHPMVSLGNKNFAGINNHYINDQIDGEKVIVSAKDIGDIFFGERINGGKHFKVVVGEPNLEKTRIAALLGPDGRVAYSRVDPHKMQLEIKAHGALATINHYDAIELSDIISGIHRAHYPDHPLRHIELISCFGALGGRRSSAQIISNRLGATVKSYRGVVQDSKSRQRGAGVMFSPRPGFGTSRLAEDERWHRRIHDFIENVLGLWGNLPFHRHSRAVSAEAPFAIVVIDILHFLHQDIDGQTLTLFYPGLLSKRALEQAALMSQQALAQADMPAGSTEIREMLSAALLTLFYGSRNMLNAMDAYILSNQDGDPNTQPVVVNGQDFCHPFQWQDSDLPIRKFHQLPSVVASKDLLSGSNIYVTSTSGRYNLKEYLIRAGSECNSKGKWPLLLANVFKDQSAFLPAMAGLRKRNTLSMEFDLSHFHFYLDTRIKTDFSLTIDMAVDNTQTPLVPLASYVHFKGKDWITDMAEDTGLKYSLLDGSEGELVLRLTGWFAERLRPLNGDTKNSSSSPPPHTTARVIICVMENDERITILQRILPEEASVTQAELAFAIASEINKYTEIIKLGVQSANDITPVKSANANYVYIHPAAPQTSWIAINLIDDD